MSTSKHVEAAAAHVHSDAKAERALLPLARAFFRELRALGTFAYLEPIETPEIKQYLETRGKFAAHLFQFLEHTANLHSVEPGIPYCYNTVDWPDDAPIAAFSDEAPAKLTDLTPSYFSFWYLGSIEENPSLENAGNSQNRLLRIALWAQQELGSDQAIELLFAFQKAGHVIDIFSNADALYNLILGQALYPEPHDLIRSFLVGDQQLPVGTRQWIDADFNNSPRFPASKTKGQASQLIRDSPLARASLQRIFTKLQAAREQARASGSADLQNQASLASRLWLGIIVLRKAKAERWLDEPQRLDELQETAKSAADYLYEIRGSTPFIDPPPVAHAANVGSEVGSPLPAEIAMAMKTALRVKRELVQERVEFLPTDRLLRHGRLQDYFSENGIEDLGKQEALVSGSQEELGGLISRLKTRDSSTPLLELVDGVAGELKQEEWLHPTIDLLRSEKASDGQLMYEHIEPLSALYPWNHWLHQEAAIASDRAGRPQEALDHILKAVILAPHSPLPFQSLGVILRRLGAREESRLVDLMVAFFKQQNIIEDR